VTGIAKLNNPIERTPVRDMLEARGVAVPVYEGNRLGIYIGWALSAVVYLALAFATFSLRWPDARRLGPGRAYGITAIALISMRASGVVILVISTIVDAGRGSEKYSRRTAWI
jgi:hypothetical protein